MRLPLAISIKSRNGMVTKDAVIINAVIESDPTSGESDVYKRPGNNDLGLIRLGKAQLLYYWNGVKAIIGDFINSGISTNLVFTGTPWTFVQNAVNLSFVNSNNLNSGPLYDLSNSVYFFGDNNTGNNTNLVWKSTNGGLTFVQSAITGLTAGLLFKIIFYNGLFYAFCIGSGGIVFSSSDGITFASVTSTAPYGARTFAAIIVFLNRIYLIGGYSAGYKNDVWYSTDGLNWVQATAAAAFSGRLQHFAGVVNGSLLIGGGVDGIGNKSDVWKTTDGVNFVLVNSSTPAALASTGSPTPSPFYSNSALYITQAITGVSVTIYRTTDGITWTTVGLIPWSDTSVGLKSRGVVLADRLRVWDNVGGVYDSFAQTTGSGVTSNNLAPSTPNLPFSAQDNGSNAATAYLMLKNANQAWTLTTASATPTLIADPNYPGTYAVTLTSLTLVGTVATATTPANTNFQVGSTVTVAGATPIAYNGAQVITGIAPATVIPANTNTLDVSITRSGTIATATSTTGPHGLVNGQTVTISGANQSEYNGVKVITWISATQFSYTVTLTTAVAGTVTPPTGAITVTGPILTGQMYNNYGGGGNDKFYIKFLNANSGSYTISVGAGVSIVIVSSQAGVSGTYTVTGIDSSSNGGAFLFTIPAFATLIPLQTATVYQAPASATLTWDGTSYVNVTTATDFKFAIAPASFGAVYFTVAGATPAIYNGTKRFEFLTGTTSFAFASSGFTIGNGDSPATPATGAPKLSNNIPSTIQGASFTFTVAGSPASPATGTITAVGGRNTVAGIVYINGYFCVMDVFGVIYSSSPDNPSVWPPLSYTTAQAENGAGVCLARSQSYVVAFKEWSTEFFYDAGNKIGSPLSPVSNGFIKIGCASGASIAELEDELIWLSQTRQKGRGVYAMRGTTQQKISTSDVDIILNRDNLSEVFAYAIKISGHGLYILTLVNTNITLVYDMASQSWSLWSSLTLNTSQSISTITQVGGLATVTFAAAHNIADGDPVAITGATQNNYNGSFQAAYISPTVLTINVSSATVTPATGTILGANYTESYFQFSKFANALGQYLVLHNTNGHLYEIKPEINQDAGIPINTFFRTVRFDGGDLSSKRMAQIDVVGDFLTDVIMVRQSDDDSVSFSLYRPVNLAEDEPMIRRLGSYRRRSLELKHNGNNPLRLTALDLT